MSPETRTGEIRMKLRGKGALLAVGLMALTVLVAPSADARPTCNEAGGVTRCETNGSVSIKAVPQTRAPNAGMIGGIGGMRRGMIWGW